MLTYIDKDDVKNDKELQEDLRQFQKYLADYKGEQDIYEIQEYILTELYILINPIFRKMVKEFRGTFHVPANFYNDRNKSIYKNWLENINGSMFERWLMSQRRDIPFDVTDQEISGICYACRVNPLIYGGFVIYYIYFGDVSIKLPSNYDYFTSNEEYRYKSNLIFNNGEYFDIGHQPAGYIQFYSNTEISDIINFIKKNEKNIEFIKKNLKSYPFTKKFFNVKRDIQIFILYLFGYSYNKIEASLLEKYGSDVGEKNIDKIIKQIDLFMMKIKNN